MDKKGYQDEVIRRLYRDSLSEKGCKDKMGWKTQEEIGLILEEKQGQMGEDEYVCYRDDILLAVSAAEENGFVDGFKYAFRLFSECIHG